MVTDTPAGIILSGNTGENFMRNSLALSTLMAFLFLPVMAAAEKTAPESVEEVEARGIAGEACFGDRYESDNDINEGNRITEEEILLLINRPNS